MPDVQYLIHCVVSFFIFKLKIDFYKLFISLINFTAEPFSQIKFFFFNSWPFKCKSSTYNFLSNVFCCQCLYYCVQFVDPFSNVLSTSNPSTVVSLTIVASSTFCWATNVLVYNILTMKNMSRGLCSSITLLLKIVT